MNFIIGYNAFWSRDLVLNKKRTYQNLSDKSFLVASRLQLSNIISDLQRIEVFKKLIEL